MAFSTITISQNITMSTMTGYCGALGHFERESAKMKVFNVVQNN